MLFSVIDNSNGYYVNKTEKRFRSRMNVIMRIAGSNADLEKKLQVEAEKIVYKNCFVYFKYFYAKCLKIPLLFH